jgi:hypothetical protein
MLIVLNYNKGFPLTSNFGDAFFAHLSNNYSHVTPLSGNKGKIPFLGGGRRLRRQVTCGHTADVHASLIKREFKIIVNC